VSNLGAAGSRALAGEERLSRGEAASIVASGKSGWIIPASVVLVAFVTYCGVLRFQFVYDDLPQIVGNPAVHSWRSVPDYFTKHVWSQLYPTTQGNYYRPIFLLWLLINHSLFGLNPVWWHLTTILLHLVVTLLVWALAARLQLSSFAAGVAAFVFGLHPVHVEAVAWISGVTEPLAAVLLMLSLLCYIGFRDASPTAARLGNQRRLPFIGALFFYALALLTKETSVILPLIIGAWEYIAPFRANLDPECLSDKSEAATCNTTRDGLEGRRLRLKTALIRSCPFLVLACLYLVARMAALKGLGHSVTQLSTSTILYTLPSVLWFYIRLLIWPANLSVFYDIPLIFSPGVRSVLLPAAVVILAAVTLVWASRRSRPARFAAILVVAPLVPLFNLAVFPEGELAHDRYLYVPSIGAALLAALLISHFPAAGMTRLFGHPALQVASALLVLCLLGAGTAMQSPNWSSDLTLYSRAVQIAPNHNTAANNLGNEMFQRGYYADGINLYQEALSRNPDFWLSNYNLGYSHYKLGELDEAEHYLRRAIAISPTDSDEFVYLGLTLSKMGRLEEAEASIRNGIGIRKDAKGYHFALAYVLKQQGRLGAALDELKLETHYNPEQSSAASRQTSEIESGGASQERK